MIHELLFCDHVQVLEKEGEVSGGGHRRRKGGGRDAPVGEREDVQGP